jgi:hypothetical protein
MSVTACHGCEKNPVKAEKAEDTMAYQMYGGLVDTIGKMVDAASFNMLDLSTVDALEFDLMRLYRRASQPRLF